MKKLFCLLFIVSLFSFFNTNVFASQVNKLSTLVILKNTSYNLELDGYILKENNVDITKEGSYLARYENSDSASFYRVIDVVSEDTLLNSMYIKNDVISSYNVGAYDKIIKIISCSKGDIILKLNEGKYILEFDFSSSLITSDCIGLATNLTVVDIFFDEELQICYGVANTKDDNIYLFLVGTNKEILYFKEYGEKNIDTASFIYTDLNYIYIGGKTLSNTSIFKHDQSGVDSFMLQIDKLNYSVNKYYDLGKEGDDQIVYFDQFNKLIVTLVNIDNNYIYEIIDVNNLFKRREIIFYNQTNIKSVIKYNDKYYILVDDDLFYYLYEVSNDTINILLKEEKAKVNKMNLSNYKNEVRLYSVNYNEHNFDLVCYVVEDKNIRKKEVISNCNYKSLYTSNNYLYLLNDTFLYKHQIKTMYAKTLGSLNVVENIEPILFINGIQKKHDLNKSYNTINYNHAGIYNVAYYYFDNDLECNLEKKVEVSSISNIKKDNTYMVGLSLFTNLTVYINDELVNNGYIFSTPGKYHIKVCGIDYSNEFDIFIIDYKEETSSFDKPNELSVESLDLSNVASEIKVGKMSTNVLLYENNYFDKLWYLLIPISALLVMGTLYFTIGRKWL